MYKTEEFLVQSILERFEKKGIGIKKYQKDKVKVLTEVNLGYGIPDIVVIHKKNTLTKIRDNALNMFDINILDIIKNKKEINIDGLLNVTKSSKTKINQSLSILVNEKIISQKGKDYFTYTNYNTDISDCIAIEVKLKNWKRALHQAHRYQWFANQSYVLLPESNIQPALKQIELFKNFNVGLLGFEKDKIIKHFIPNKEKPVSNKMNYLLNEEMIFRNRSKV